MRALTLLLLLALAACGTLPQPFYGNPGVTGARLAQPPPSRLAVQYPAQSLLPDAAAAAWAHAVATALLDQEIPADARQRTRADWSLDLTASLRGNVVVPNYTVRNPAGVAQGSAEGAPVPAAAWASGTPQVLKAAADGAAPRIAGMLNSIEAARRESDPNSLLNRSTRVYLVGVTGAPGDGAQSLPRQMRLKLESHGLVVQDQLAGSDFQVRGEIRTAPGANGTERVELQWIVDGSGSETGRVVQINEVDPRTISPFWGDTAVAVATQAAAGVREVISNAGGAHGPRTPKPDAAAKPGA